MDVFISYSHQDSLIAQIIKKFVELEGYTVWMDISDIDGGSEWRVELESALDKSTILILLLSNASISSDYVGEEVSIFDKLIKKDKKKERKIIPVKVSRYTFKPGWKWLEKTQIIGFMYTHKKFDFEKSYEDLINSIKSITIGKVEVPTQTEIINQNKEMDISARMEDTVEEILNRVKNIEKNQMGNVNYPSSSILEAIDTIIQEFNKSGTFLHMDELFRQLNIKNNITSTQYKDLVKKIEKNSLLSNSLAS